MKQHRQSLHQLKVEKKTLSDQPKAAVSETKSVQASKDDSRVSLAGKYKICEERLKLTHQSDMNKKLLGEAKHAITLDSKEDKIKSLKTQIESLKGKAKQYDNIASTGIKSMIALRAFNQRATTR